MAVGTTALTCYQGEDVSWEFTITISGVTDASAWDVELVVKQTAAAVDPPLIGPVTGVSTGALKFMFNFNMDVDPGTYVYSVRRVDSGASWQLAQAATTVLDSASVDLS